VHKDPNSRQKQKQKQSKYSSEQIDNDREVIPHSSRMDVQQSPNNQTSVKHKQNPIEEVIPNRVVNSLQASRKNTDIDYSTIKSVSKQEQELDSLKNKEIKESINNDIKDK